MFMMTMILVACKKNKMEVYYILPYVDFTTQVTPERFDKRFAAVKNINSYPISKDTVDFIKAHIKRLSPGDMEDLDVRLFVKIDTLELYMDTWGNAFSKDSYKMDIPPYIFYLIKVCARYYDYIEPEELYWRKEIKKYGIPANYHYTPRNSANVKTILH